MFVCVSACLCCCCYNHNHVAPWKIVKTTAAENISVGSRARGRDRVRLERARSEVREPAVGRISVGGRGLDENGTLDENFLRFTPRSTNERTEIDAPLHLRTLSLSLQHHLTNVNIVRSNGRERDGDALATGGASEMTVFRRSRFDVSSWEGGVWSAFEFVAQIDVEYTVKHSIFIEFYKLFV